MGKIVLLYVLSFALICSCAQVDTTQKQTVNALKLRIESLKQSAPNSGAAILAALLEKDLLGATIPAGLTKEEAEGLQFLYAYMPINDMAQMPYSYFIKTVKEAYATKSLPWGASVTPELFRHFVLPPRVNNEDLDNAREIFYRELYPRVKDMNMYDAVIEINHWCREKIVYKPADDRTTSPAQTVNRAYGRCGEESVVAVAALRSVGIPARQVYVPLWAHTDDNHAWVEVWVEGEWYYLGACEPEPLLNRGWFTSSASRAMLVNTYAFGRVDPGMETRGGEIVSESALFTEIGNTSAYGDTKKAVVKILDGHDRAVEGASVLFELYNYTSLHSISSKYSDKDGIARLTTGFGTLVVETFFRIDGEEYYAMRPYNIPDIDTLVIKVDRDERKGTATGEVAVTGFRITPPVETRFADILPEDVQRVHGIRCAEDDAIRFAHIASFRFKDAAEAKRFSAEMVKAGLNRDMEEELADLLVNTLSNGFEVEKFLRSTDTGHLGLAVQLLMTVRVKDLQEIEAATFADYLNGVIRLGDIYKDDYIFRETILNPRIGNEAPQPYKAQLWNILSDSGMKSSGKEAIVAVAAALEKITLVDSKDVNPRNFNMTPASIAAFGMADANAYNLYAKALFHTAGIPTSINVLNGRLQIYYDNEWHPYKLITDREVVTEELAGPAILNVRYPEGEATQRRYSLEYWIGDSYRDSWGVTSASSGNITAPGYYRIVTGIRAADGSILAEIKTFEVKPNSNQTIVMEYFPFEKDELVVIGAMDTGWKYTSDRGEPTSIINTVGRNLFVLAVAESGREPSTHFLNDLASIGNGLKLATITIFPTNEIMDFVIRQDYKMGSNVTFGYDSDDVIVKGLERSLGESGLRTKLPVVIVADSFGNIYYASVGGYGNGIPEAISKLDLPIADR